MIAVQKQKFDIKVTVTFNKNGGDSVSYQTKDYVIGTKYSDLPIATKTNYDMKGWYTASSGGKKVTKEDLADGTITMLYAQWEEATNFTSFEVTTTSSYTKFGIYSATLKSGATSVTINWGDGNIEELTSVSQKVHTYSTAGTYVVKINDRISTIQISTNNNTWYTTTSQVRYTLKKILTYSTSITSIPAYCYYYCYYLSSVIGIGDSNITTLPTYCFYQCYNLSSLNGLSKITSIGTYCFYQCYCLSSFTGLGNITYLPDYSFQGCYCITSLATLPSTVISYGQYCLAGTRISDLSKVRSSDTLNPYCFSGMNSLTSIATLTPRSSLPAYCFQNCTGMKTVNFSSWTSLTAIPSYCFYSNTALTSVTFNSQLKNIGSDAFYCCYASNMKSISLKDTQLTSIDTYAFQGCYNLTSMSLPSTLTYLYNYSLAGCYNLKEISCYASTAPTTYINTFGNTDSNDANAYVGRNVRTAENNKLYVSNPDTYKTSYWSSVLLDSSKCGYKFRTFDQYDIRGCDINGLSARYEYTGSEIVPSITVLNQAGTTLVENTSYTKALANNVECGTASLSVTGIGSYHGTQVKTFKIYDPSQQSYEVDLNGQWRTPPQAWTNSDTRFNVYESNSNYNVGNGYAKMYINVDGYTDLDIYINSYAESNYDYTIAFQADKDVTSLPTKDTAGALTSTYGYQYNPSSYTIDSGTGWKKVSYSLDGGEHKIMICYRKDGSVNSGFDRGYVAIAKL